MGSTDGTEGQGRWAVTTVVAATVSGQEVSLEAASGIMAVLAEWGNGSNSSSCHIICKNISIIIITNIEYGVIFSKFVKCK